MDAPLGINAPVDRLNIKNQSQRNKEQVNKAKVRKEQQKKRERKMIKDIERLENLEKQVQNESEFYKKKNDNKLRALSKERDLQENVGVVTKNMKVLGRFKYKQRKSDFQLQEDLAGNLR